MHIKIMRWLKVEEVAEQQLLVNEGERKAAAEVDFNQSITYNHKLKSTYSTSLSLSSKSQ